jgi:C1A family cysteine protease
MQTQQYLTLTGTNRPQGKAKTFKMVIAGTVALTAVAVAALCLGQHRAEEIRFYGEISEKQAAFMQFIAKYGKTYAAKSDMGSRFQTFSANYDRVQAHNSLDNAFKMGVNRFSDMTEEEFTSMYGTQGL